MNCSQAGTSTLRVVAGTKVSRVIKRRLITLGLGVISRSPVSPKVSAGGTLRPKRV